MGLARYGVIDGSIPSGLEFRFVGLWFPALTSSSGDFLWGHWSSSLGRLSTLDNVGFDTRQSGKRSAIFLSQDAG
jgi:hypothetical protein